MMNARERAARRAGFRPEPSSPTPTRPATGREQAEERDTRLELETWVLKSIVVRVLKLGAVIFGLVEWWREGVPGLVAAGLVLWVLSKASPAPSERLDRYTKR